MKKVFIVHGFEGEPNGGWKPWLMSELNKLDIYACSLPMPNPSEPKVEEWVGLINYVVKNPNEEIFLVGHSLGVPTVLRYLESLLNDIKIGGVVLVSGPYKKLETQNPNSKIRKIDNFLETDFNFKKIKVSCEKFVIVHGDNDDSVPFEHALFLSKNLDAKITTVHNGGHLSGHEGFNELPEVLEALKEMIK